jgi:hypothetical protein
VVIPVDADRGWVLVIRVWYEPGSRAEGFRARITSTHALDADQPETTVVASPDAVLAAVGRWLSHSGQ